MFAVLGGGAKAPTIHFKSPSGCCLLLSPCFQCFCSCQGAQVSSVLYPVLSHGEEVPV